MALLYADEDFDYPVVECLRKLGYDVLTAQQAGQANKNIPDVDVLTFAIGQSRAIVTHNRRHFIKLHHQNPSHAGIIVCTRDDDSDALAHRIHRALSKNTDLTDKLLRINLPAKP